MVGPIHSRQSGRPQACLRFALASLALLSAAGSASAQAARRFADGELAPLAKSLAAYLDARTKALGLETARQGLTTALDELARKDPPRDPLRHPADLGRAQWLSRGYGESKPRTGAVVTENLDLGSFSGGGLEIAYRLPKDYSPRTTAYPLILAIPDFDERPADHLRAQWILPELLDAAILVSPAMPSKGEEWTRVMVNGRPGGLSHALTALRIAGERFAVDFDRVYVAGRGKSVPAAISAGNYGPQLFAGVVGRAGDAGEQGPENFANLPVLFAGGGAKATAFQEAARSAGSELCTILPSGTELDVWTWMQAHPRQTFPTSVTVTPGDPFPTRAYWLRIAPTASDARVTAKADRSANTISIEGHGASLAILYLNDALLDLDRPVRVLANGVEQAHSVRRHFPTMLDLIYDGTSDPACVYVAEVACDLRESVAASSSGSAAAEDGEYAERLAAAGGDAAKLWELYVWCGSTQREARQEAVLRRLLRSQPDHAEARAALGHVQFEGRWFSSQAALERFQRSQDPETARSRGWVEHKGRWVHPDERALPGKGWVEDPETGLWLAPADQKRLQEGWVRQDLAWIRPEDAARFDDGLWWVDGEWLELASADRRHARIDNPWCIPDAEVLLFSAADRAVSLRAIREMGRALDDLRKVFGAEPALPLSVALLRDEEQYDRFAFGDPDGRRPATHAGRLHVIHSAFLAESGFPRAEGELSFQGMGVCYWDSQVPNGDLYGVHSARLAAGLSYVDALDPSPKAVRKALADGPGVEYYAAYHAEKLLPAWLRWGGPVYAERFFHDVSVGADGDPWWARRWSLDNLASRGGLRPSPEILAFKLDPENREDGLKLLIEAGLVVAFVVDGDCAPVKEAHAALKKGLVSGRPHANHGKALTEAVLAHRAELRAFAGL